MAYQKLQTSRAADVTPSDTLEIPSISSENGRGNNGCILYIGLAGNLKVKTAGGDTVVFSITSLRNRNYSRFYYSSLVICQRV